MDRDNVKRRDWVFTLNNWTVAEVDRVNAIECKYIVYGKEVGASGTPHLQGFVYFKNPRVFNGVKSLFPERVHLEVCRHMEKAIDYCKKGEQSHQEWEDHGVDGVNFGKNAVVFQKGTPPLSQKEKGDMEVERYEDAKRLAMEGQLEDIPGDIFIRCYKSLTAIKKDYMNKPNDLNDVCGVWIHGKSGIGKSRMARHVWPGLFDKLINKWWDGYQGEKHVLLDDFDPSHACLFHYLKRWADRYSFTCENKGGGLCIRPSTIIVTSQYRPDEIWLDAPTRDAIYRRFKVIHVSEPYVEGHMPFDLFGGHVDPPPLEQYVPTFVPPQVGEKRQREEDFGDILDELLADF